MTLERCLQIVKENNVFKHKREEVCGNTVDIFSYMLASYKDFEEHDAFELRGIAFVNGEKFLSIPKFFNVNETESTLIEKLVNKKVVDVREKADGSMIQFINVGCKWIAKSKFSLTSEQALAAQEIFNKNENLQRFVQFCYVNKLHPIFEYISPENRIVLKYNKSDLKLLQIREENGNFLDYKRCKVYADEFGISIVESYNYTLEDLIQKAKTDTDIEGWIVRFHDGQIVKIKTDWYFKNHKLLTDDLANASTIVQYIIEEEIDDILSQLDEENEIKEKIKEIQNLINHYVADMVEKVLFYKQILDKMSRKEFALEYKTYDFFPFVMRLANENKNLQEKAEDEVKKFILKETNKKEKAERFIKKLKERGANGKLH